MIIKLSKYILFLLHCFICLWSPFIEAEKTRDTYPILSQKPLVVKKEPQQDLEWKRNMDAQQFKRPEGQRTPVEEFNKHMFYSEYDTTLLKLDPKSRSQFKTIPPEDPIQEQLKREQLINKKRSR